MSRGYQGVVNPRDAQARRSSEGRTGLPEQRTILNLRRTLVSAEAYVAGAATILIGTAAPASAGPIIPSCGNVFNGIPRYWDAFVSVNHDTATPYSPTPRLFGSDFPVLKNMQRVWGGTTCSWRLTHGKTTQNFTISEVAMTPSRDALLRRWYSLHGIVGVDREPTLGGVAYQVSPHELDVLMHGRVWIAITERNTSVEGYTMQAATSTIIALNPSIVVGTD